MTIALIYMIPSNEAVFERFQGLRYKLMNFPSLLGCYALSIDNSDVSEEVSACVFRV